MQPVQARAEVLAALEAVDLVVVFDEDTPEKLIARVKPTVLVKGGDYTREQVVGREHRRGARRRGDPDRSGARPFDHRHGRERARAEAALAVARLSHPVGGLSRRTGSTLSRGHAFISS